VYEKYNAVVVQPGYIIKRTGRVRKRGVAANVLTRWSGLEVA